jgi:hypothetical protein
MAGNSSDDTIICNYAADSTAWLHGSDLAAGSSLSCSGSFSFSQDAIEAGDISPAVTATAANLAAGPVTEPLPPISVLSTPSVSATVGTSICTVPTHAGGPGPGCILTLLLLQLLHSQTFTSCGHVSAMLDLFLA